MCVGAESLMVLTFACLVTATKKLGWSGRRWLFDGLGGWKDACDVGVEFECSVEPVTEEFSCLENLDNSAKTMRFTEKRRTL